mgnify:CR=1 FL=1
MNRFNVEKFRKNADRAIRNRVPQSHLDVLNGMKINSSGAIDK